MRQITCCFLIGVIVYKVISSVKEDYYEYFRSFSQIYY